MEIVLMFFMILFYLDKLFFYKNANFEIDKELIM